MKTENNNARTLTLALAATTGMWVFTYLALLFSGKMGGEVLFVLAVLCLPLAAKCAESKSSGAMVGLYSALLNLLLVGSWVGSAAPGEVLLWVGEMLLWAIGLICVSVILGVIGSAFNKNMQSRSQTIDWEHAFFAVASVLVFLMLVTGGIVTGMKAGLAVPDWPNSYGHNMLLYPLTEIISSEDKGVFFEHAHRLTGMFVGLTSLIMVVCAWRWKASSTVRSLVIIVFFFVCIQGLLGGLRVLLPNLFWPRPVHGVVGQLTFAGVAWIAVMTRPSWKTIKKTCSVTDRKWATALVHSMGIQLIFGALYRHMIADEVFAAKATHVLYTHIIMAVVILVLAVVVGLRSRERGASSLYRLGTMLLILVCIQLLLGGGSLVAVILSDGTSLIPLYKILLTTAHQANGALLLATSVVIWAWIARSEGL